jgi:hypothetical protein
MTMEVTVVVVMVLLDDSNNDEPLQIFNDIYIYMYICSRSHMRLRKASLPLTTRLSRIASVKTRVHQ